MQSATYQRSDYWIALAAFDLVALATLVQAGRIRFVSAGLAVRFVASAHEALHEFTVSLRLLERKCGLELYRHMSSVAPLCLDATGKLVFATLDVDFSYCVGKDPAKAANNSK